MLPTMYSTRNQEWLPTLFSDLFNDNWVAPRFRATTPAINVTEDEKEYLVEVAAPGMTKNDFNVHLSTDGDIVISMEKKSDNKDEKKNKTYLRREFSYSKFEQRFSLPEDIDREKISAAMNDGVLTIAIPKIQPEEKAKAEKCIEIK
jgi:HSP20 family protein